MKKEDIKIGEKYAVAGNRAWSMRHHEGEVHPYIVLQTGVLRRLDTRTRGNSINDGVLVQRVDDDGQPSTICEVIPSRDVRVEWATHYADVKHEIEARKARDAEALAAQKELRGRLDALLPVDLQSDDLRRLGFPHTDIPFARKIVTFSIDELVSVFERVAEHAAPKTYEPVVVDTAGNKMTISDMQPYPHVHDTEGNCVKNRAGTKCAASRKPVTDDEY